jgi:hypothetical protein
MQAKVAAQTVYKLLIVIKRHREGKREGWKEGRDRKKKEGRRTWSEIQSFISVLFCF